ncbi:MAG: ABC transporter ATP-binding protein [Oscillospiraceae bacterium]
MKTIMKVQDITLKRGSFSLDGINLDIRENEILSILGKTGSGKTMLLETIAGFYRPDTGDVLYHGKSVSRMPVYERNIGYLYQDYCLFPHMTVQANIEYGLKMRKCDKVEMKSRVESIADRFEIEHILHQYPGTLSGGEQQRTALARALVTRPELLLLDEPFSALDPVTKKKVYELIREIRQEFKCTVVFVTHDFNEAEQLSDRIGVIISGRLCGVAEGSELYTNTWDPEVKDFLGIAHHTTREGKKHEQGRVVCEDKNQVFVSLEGT